MISYLNYISSCSLCQVRGQVPYVMIQGYDAVNSWFDMFYTADTKWCSAVISTSGSYLKVLGLNLFTQTGCPVIACFSSVLLASAEYNLEITMTAFFHMTLNSPFTSLHHLMLFHDAVTNNQPILVQVCCAPWAG